MRRFDISSSAVLQVLMLACVFILSEGAVAQAPRTATVEVGKETSFGMRREVNGRSTQVSASDLAIARGWWDGNLNKLRIEGLSPGRTQITFTGTYREIIVGGVLRERAVPFRDVVDVTVLARTVPVDSRAITIQVTGNKHRDYSIHVLLGPQFRNKNEEGLRWRNVSFTGGNGAIARGLYDDNQLKLRITGVKGGTTQMTLTGERFVERTWQRVVRDLSVKVVPGAGTMGEIEPDVWLEGLRRSYQQIQPSVERGARGELLVEQKADVRRNLENLGTVVENGIRNLAGTADDREEIIAPRRTLLGEIQRDIRRLREYQPPTNPPAIELPGSVGSHRGQNGKRFTFKCAPNPGGAGGTVWGTDVYTDDSPICKAAVHAGLITYASGGTVIIEIRPGQQSYAGSERNGVSTSNWGGWGGSYVFVR